MNVLGIAADITGIISFFLSIALLIKSEALRKEIEAQKSEYRKSQRDIKVGMKALRDNVWKDQILNLRIVSEIRTLLYTFEQKFGRLLTRDDKSHLKDTLRLLDSSIENIDRARLCKELDYFIARFERQEIK